MEGQSISKLEVFEDDKILFTEWTKQSSSTRWSQFEKDWSFKI